MEYIVRLIILINQLWIDNNQLLGIIININYGLLLLSTYWWIINGLYLETDRDGLDRFS
jgi:hypothetical protein